MSEKSENKEYCAINKGSSTEKGWVYTFFLIILILKVWH